MSPQAPLSNSRDDRSTTLRRNLWVVARRFTAVSQTWLWRQTAGFEELSVRVVCWERVNANDYPFDGSRVCEVPFPSDPSSGPLRHFQRLRNIGTGNFYGTSGRERKWLIDLGRRHRPDAMLCHFGYTALRMLPVAQRLGVPIVAHFHGLDLSSGLRNKWYRWSLVRHLQRFRDVVVVGSHQREWMINHGVRPENVKLIPCGVPTSQFHPGRSNPETGVRFIAVSRLTLSKGTHYTLAAFAKTAVKVKNATLLVVGDGPERGRLMALAANLGVEERVTFLGSVTDSEVKSQMQHSDVFLQHSLDGDDGWVEGFGVSISEAAACELPVVVTRCGGIPDQVIDGETGVIVPQRDVDAMADAMIVLAHAPDLRRRYGTAGRRRMVTQYDTTLQVGKLEALLIDAIDGSASE